MFTVKNIEVDHINYHGNNDFQVFTQYINENSFCIGIKRLDTVQNEGWGEQLELLLHNHKGFVQRYRVGPSQTSTIYILINKDINPLLPLEIGDNLILDESYEPLKKSNRYHISREEFNQIFNTDIVHLPSNLFAVGKKYGIVYQYHDSYGGYPWDYEINLSIDHIVSCMVEDMYCVVCAYDGYIEGIYPSKRNVPRIIEKDKYIGKSHVEVTGEHDFPVLHRGMYILGQSVHPDISYTLPIPDRYYFCCNRYNMYHSIHQGIPFETKINKIVYACNPRGSKYNFTKRRDIQMSQREYFKSDAVSKENIYTKETIDRMEMIRYKYILDIDGNSNTWDATAWKLNSGSVIFKTDSNWVQWFYEYYKPWVHYIPINDDFSNLQEMYQWTERHPEECKQMIQECKKLFKHVYNYKNVIQSTQKTLNKLKEI